MDSKGHGRVRKRYEQEIDKSIEETYSEIQLIVIDEEEEELTWPTWEYVIWLEKQLVEIAKER